MPATAAQVARLRRMVDEPADTTYSDGDLATYLEEWPLVDADGNEPDDTDWVDTYDLHAAARDIWTEKAAAVAYEFQFAADGGSFSRHQKFEHAMKQARYHAARRRVGNIAIAIEPPPGSREDVWRFNYNDPYSWRDD